MSEVILSEDQFKKSDLRWRSQKPPVSSLISFSRENDLQDLNYASSCLQFVNRKQQQSRQTPLFFSYPHEAYSLAKLETRLTAKPSSLSLAIVRESDAHESHVNASSEPTRTRVPQEIILLEDLVLHDDDQIKSVTEQSKSLISSLASFQEQDLKYAGDCLNNLAQTQLLSPAVHTPAPTDAMIASWLDKKRMKLRSRL